MSVPKSLEMEGIQFTRVSLIGQGGAGQVWEYQHSDKRYAVKFLNNAMEQRKQRFEKELTFLKKVSHPNLVRIVADGATSDGLRWYAMPLFDGTLRDTITKQVNTSAEMLDYILQLASAISYIHERGIAHRDLKPENILIDGSVLVIADFGMAHFIDSQLTQASDLLANRDYASPEQRKRGAANDVGPAADIYAFGLMINECLVGERPLGSAYRTIETAQPTMFELDELVRRMIAQREDERPKISDVITDIKYIKTKCADQIRALRRYLEVDLPNKGVPNSFQERILQQASEDLWYAQHSLWGKNPQQLKRYNQNWHSPLGYDADDFLLNLYVQAKILFICERKFRDESIVYAQGSTYLPLDLASNAGHQNLYKRMQNILASHPNDRRWDLSGRILKTFASCVDYHCQEILNMADEVVKNGLWNLRDKPLVWLIQAITEALADSPFVLSEIEDVAMHIGINWERSSYFPQDKPSFDVLIDPHDQSLIDKTLETLRTTYPSVSFAQADSDTYSVKFRSIDEFRSFDDHARALSKPDYYFEGDVLDLLESKRIHGSIVELLLERVFDIPITLARILGLIDAG